MNEKDEQFFLKGEKGDKIFKGKGYEILYYSEDAFVKDVLLHKNDLTCVGHIDITKPADDFEKENLMQAYLPNSDVSFSYFTTDKKIKVLGYIPMGETSYLTVVKSSKFKLNLFSMGLLSIMFLIATFTVIY